MEQLVGERVVAGELGWQQSVLSGGGGIGLTMHSSNPDTNHPGEQGIGITVICGGSGWRESTNGAPLAKNLSTAEAARANRSPELRCSSSYDWGRGELWGG